MDAIFGKTILKQVSHCLIQFPKKLIKAGLLSLPLVLCYTHLLHLEYEEKIDPEIKNWLSYAVEKLDEINLIGKSFFGKKLNKEERSALKTNQSRHISLCIYNETIQQNGIHQ